MKTFFIAASLMGLWTLLIAQEAAPKQENKRPFMMSFTDLKRVELPERKGMQFAILSGDPKTGPYTQIRKVPAGTDNELHSHGSEIKNVIISVAVAPAVIASFTRKAKVSSTSNQWRSGLAAISALKSQLPAGI